MTAIGLARQKRPKVHIVEVLLKSVSNDYIAYLRDKDISYIFAGRDSLDPKLIIPVEWDCCVSFGLFHAPNHSLAVRHFLNAAKVVEL